MITPNILKEKGFALVATLSVLSLVVLIALAMLSLATVTSKTVGEVNNYGEIAKANARLALAEAVQALQETLGLDQAVCAAASILETPDDPQTSFDETGYVQNRHWLGVWETTVEDRGKRWPVVGKLGTGAGEGPYRYSSGYSDLRYFYSGLASGAWKEKMRKRWLVSGGNLVSHDSILTTNDGSAVEILGGGTLGVDRGDAYEKNRVIVPLQKIIRSGVVTGSYGYWVTNENLKANDVISSINNIEIEYASDIRKAVSELPNQTAVFDIYRQDRLIQLPVKIGSSIKEDGKEYGVIGVSFGTSRSLFESFSKAIYETYNLSLKTLQFIGKMITGNMGTENLSGPIGIAQMAGNTAQAGFIPFMYLMALLSISLGVLNLLPIPVLDGGQLVLLSLEAIRGKPLEEKMENFIYTGGALLVGALIIFAIFNDISRFF